MKNLSALVEVWRREGVEIFPPNDAAEIQGAFAAVGAVATSDVIELYSAVGGTPGTDEGFWSLWSLEQIRAENQVKTPFGVLFSDYMISCWCYRLRPNAQSTSSVLVDRFDGKEPSVVAESVEEFITLYLQDPLHLMNAGSLEESRLHR